jgi:GAF domain
MGAAVTLMSTSGSEAVAAVSDEATRRIEEMQFDFGEGPGRDAFRAGRPVLTSDLHDAFGSWPAYAPAVHAAGVGSVFAFPLQLGGSRFGVLTFYVQRPRSLNAAEVAACLTLAELATETLLDGQSGEQTRAPGVPRSLRFRSEVYQAQGMVMVDLRVGLADALARMRAHAFAAGIELDVLALEIIAGRTRLDRGEDT